MSDAQVEKTRKTTARYRLVMVAAGIAAARREGSLSGIITVEDVFMALCHLYPETFSELLGTTLPVPQQPENDGEPRLNIRMTVFSSEVDRYLSPFGGVIEDVLSSFPAEDVEVDSLHIAAAFLWDPIPPVENLLAVAGYPRDRVCAAVTSALRGAAEAAVAGRRKTELARTFDDISAIRTYMKERCFGQDAAIDTIVTQLSIAWGMSAAGRSDRPLSFFLVGAPGTGKNHVTDLLQSAFEEVLGIPRIPVVDFARYATEQLPIDLIGRDSTWKDGGHEGVLTHAASENPRGIIVIENYERGHACAVSYLDSILETGFAEDAFTKKNVCFAQNVIVVITHKKEFAESDEFLALASGGEGTPPRDKIVEGLVKYAPTFHSTLRLVDAPVFFPKHTCRSFLSIVRDKVAALENRFRDAYGAKCVFQDEDVLQLMVEMHPNVSSAHPIVSAIESSVLIPLQDWLLRNYPKFEKRRKIRIRTDRIPDFEGAPRRKDFGSFEDWLTARTAKRVLQAKRLSYRTKIVLTKDAVELRFTNLSFVVLPSIEDSGYFSVTVPDVSFSDLVGVGLVRERIAEVIDYFNHPTAGLVRPDTGIILYGPPGTGKTSVAKAVARELGVPFIMAMGADFTKPHVGEGVESVKRLFAAARRYGAVVFIDEIDGIGSRNGESAEGARVINALLTELDGFRERNMLVIGATNRYEALDEALVRPGRLSLKIQLGLLHSREDRAELIRHALGKVKAVVADEVLDRLVDTTPAWSPANLLAMVNGGVRIARRKGETLAFGHFVEARTVVLLGEDPQRTSGDGRDAWITAVHEAGHAVTAALLGIPFVQATVQGVGSTAGFVEHLGTQGFATEDSLSRMLEMTLGGRAAESILAEPSDGVQSDFEHATELAARMIQLGLVDGTIFAAPGEGRKEFMLRHREKIEGILSNRMTAARTLLTRHRIALEAVAEALRTQKVLFEADIRAIIAEREGGADGK